MPFRNIKFVLPSGFIRLHSSVLSTLHFALVHCSIVSRSSRHFYFICFLVSTVFITKNFSCTLVRSSLAYIFRSLLPSRRKLTRNLRTPSSYLRRHRHKNTRKHTQWTKTQSILFFRLSLLVTFRKFFLCFHNELNNSRSEIKREISEQSKIYQCIGCYVCANYCRHCHHSHLYFWQFEWMR